jgi:flagellar biosynthetic protein FlhB
MSEDRTQPPSKRRRQQAREQGRAVHSPELTAAVGWLVAVGALGIFGDDLARVMVGLVKDSMTRPAAIPGDPAGVVSRIRSMVLVLAWPLGVILAAFAAAALAAHQLQVRGLFATSLIAPDLARLWTPAKGPGLAVRLGNVAWATLKAVVVVIVSAWVIRAGWDEIQGLSRLEALALARAAAQSAFRLVMVLAGMLLILGLVDYSLRFARFETMLRTTAQEQREDQRVIEGDPAARAQRRRIAHAWRGDSPERLAGASLVLIGPGGLTMIFSGGPPPQRVAIRTVARGEPGQRLRRSAEAAKIPSVEAGDLALLLARHSTVGSPVPAERVVELAAVWPPQPRA